MTSNETIGPRATPERRAHPRVACPVRRLVCSPISHFSHCLQARNADPRQILLPQPMNPDSKIPFRHRVRVYMEDTDMGGVVYYANYIKFFERARTEWLRSRGISPRLLREQHGGMFVIGDTSVRYVKPARLDQELEITVVVTEVGRASVVVAQQAWCGDELLAEGKIRVSWVDADTLRPMRLPDTVFEPLRQGRSDAAA